MGLDMYLVEKKGFFVGNPKAPEHTKLVEALGNLVDTDRGSISITVDQEKLYWRKANAIHQWFVNNVQDGEDDCKEYHVSYQDLARLKDTCDQVIADPDLADELLPTSSGFFFGGTDYDDDYIGDLKYTSFHINEMLKSVSWETLKDPDSEVPDSNYFYQSSW